MKQLSSAAFRKAYASLSEPVEVTAYGRVIGRYTPLDGSSTAATNGAVEDEAVPEERVLGPTPEPRMTIRPALRARPTIVAEQKRVLDPLDMRKVKRERDEEIMRRLNAGHRSK